MGESKCSHSKSKRFYLKSILPATLPVKIILLNIFQPKYTLYPARGTLYSLVAIFASRKFLWESPRDTSRIADSKKLSGSTELCLFSVQLFRLIK